MRSAAAGTRSNWGWDTSRTMGASSDVRASISMIAMAGGAMLAGVAEAEPDRSWFGRGGCVEQHDDGTFAVFVRGELLGTFSAADVATRDVFIAVVMEQASREDLARAFRVSLATVGRVACRHPLQARRGSRRRRMPLKRAY